MTNERIEIVISSESLSSRLLKESLESLPKWEDDTIELQLRKSPFRTRDTDPTVLVALLNIAGAGLSALIAGLFHIMAEKSKAIAEKSKGKIVIKCDNTTIEVPAGTSMEEIDKLLKKVNGGSITEINIET